MTSLTGLAAGPPESQGHGSSSEPRVALAGGWRVWPWVWVRSAGFPAGLVDSVACPRSAEIAGRIAELAADLDRHRRTVIEACERVLPGERGAASSQLAKLVRRLRTDGAAAATELELVPAEARASAAALTAGAAAAQAAGAELESAFGNETAAARAQLQGLVATGAMREALIWQNRALVHGAAASFLRRSPEKADSKTREYERVLATYLQRYAVKNDTIGFFGPVGWASFDDEVDALAADTPTELCAVRTVYFEHWAIDALAQSLARDPQLRVHLAPRRSPTVRLDGSTLHFGLDGTTTALPAPFAQVLASCDAETSAAELAERIAGDPACELESSQEVLEVLAELYDKHLVYWTLEVPTGIPRPEVWLRRRLEAVPDRAARRSALADLDRLEALRAEVSASAGQVDQLDRALGALETGFAELTGVSATRRAGQTYAGRSIVYEDCRRAGTIKIGRQMRQAMARPLELVLQSARWYSAQIGQRYGELFRSTYRHMVEETGTERIPLVQFKHRIDSAFTGAQSQAPEIVKVVAQELRERWAGILAIPSGARVVERNSAELAPLVAEAFAAPGPGWPNARYHSPDILIAGRDVAAIGRGEFCIVLGELHTGVNTLLTHVAMEQNPRPEAMVAAREEDRPDIGIAPVEAREHAGRADIGQVSRRDVHLELGATRSRRPRDQVIAVADMVVEQTDGRVTVASRDGRHRFDPVAFFDQDITFASTSSFGLLPPAQRSPRVVLDRLIVAREKWRFIGDQLSFATQSTPVERFIAVQRWRRDNQLPRRVFVVVPEEPKPLYVDLSSSTMIEVLTRWAKKTDNLSVSEMCPDLDQLWLSDASDRRYTCELRIVAIDPVSWCPQ